LALQCLVAILLTVFFPGGPVVAQSPQPGVSSPSGRVALVNSVVAVPANPVQAGAAALVRDVLTPDEAQSTVEFAVVLKMRDFAALKERLARNEVISAGEMAAKYLPTAADYTKVAEWLTAQGLSIQPATLDRISIFASGTVAQIQRVLGTKFGRVNMLGA
jgi:hypothetical protein